MRNLGIRVAIVLSIAALAVGVLSDTSAALEAAAASKLVTIFPSGFTKCPRISGAFAYDTRVLSNGKLVPLTIPTNEVLVITRATVSQLGGHGVISGHEINISLFTGFQIAFSIATGTSNNNFDDDRLFPSGIVVAAGTPLCVGAHDLTAGKDLTNVGGFAYGFFAPNQ